MSKHYSGLKIDNDAYIKIIKQKQREKMDNYDKDKDAIYNKYNHKMRRKMARNIKLNLAENKNLIMEEFDKHTKDT